MPSGFAVVLLALACSATWSAAWGLAAGRRHDQEETSTCDPEGLKLVFAVWRHGDRNPIYSYPNDPYGNMTYKPDGMGNLNNQGKRRAYELGKLLRRRYGCFLGAELTPDLLALRSSAVHRATQTGGLVLAGLMPPAPVQTWSSEQDETLGHLWQPVHFNTVPEQQDAMLMPVMGCPAISADKDEALRLVTPRLNSLGRGGLDQFVAQQAGFQPEDATFSSVGKVADTLVCQESLGLELPAWTASVYPSPLKEILAIYTSLLDQTDKQKRLMGGVFLNELLNVSLSLRAGELPSETRMQVYSAHDLSLISILSVLGVWDGVGPTFSSALVIELREDPVSGGLGLQFLFRQGTESDEFVPIKLPKCDIICPLDQFQDLYEDVIMTEEQWQTECFQDS